MGQDELAEGVVQGEAVDGAAPHGDYELCGGAVHCESVKDQYVNGVS